MNERNPKNREYWIQIITTIPEISSSDHSSNQTTDKRIQNHGNQAFLKMYHTSGELKWRRSGE
jgi:hypothetical protein